MNLYTAQLKQKATSAPRSETNKKCL